MALPLFYATTINTNTEETRKQSSLICYMQNEKATEFNFSSLYFSYLQNALKSPIITKLPEYTYPILSVNYENYVILRIILLQN